MERKRPKTRQLHNLKGDATLEGSFWGLLFGLLFFVPLFGVAVGAAMGLLTGSLTDGGIDDDFIDGVRSESAGEEPDRFRGVSYRENDRGIAVLDGVVAHIECVKQNAVPGGDHSVFIGLVVGGNVTDRLPLLYYRGGYAGLSR